MTQSASILSRMKAPLALAFVLGVGGLVLGPAIRLVNALALETSVADAIALTAIDLVVALVFALISAVIAFAEAAKVLTAEIATQRDELRVISQKSQFLGREVAPAIGPILSDQTTAAAGLRILNEVAGFYSKIQNFDPRTKEACLEVVRDTLDDMDQLLKPERGAFLTASQCIGLYRMLVKDAPEFTLIERKPLSPTKHYSPNFVQFLRDLRRERPNIQLRYILCCDKRTLEVGATKPSSDNQRAPNLAHQDLAELVAFLNSINMTPTFVSNEDLAFVGLHENFGDMFHLHFGTTVFCSVRPPVSNTFREQAFRFNIWNEATEPELGRWVRECKSLAIEAIDADFFRKRTVEGLLESPAKTELSIVRSDGAKDASKA